MQINLNQIAMIVIVVGLLMLLGPERVAGFGRDLQKAWRDFAGIFKR